MAQNQPRSLDADNERPRPSRGVYRKSRSRPQPHLGQSVLKTSSAPHIYEFYRLAPPRHRQRHDRLRSSRRIWCVCR